MNPVEQWKAEKHGLDVWPDVLRYAQSATPMSEIPTPDLERMKWYGTFYRKRDGQGTYMLRIRIPGGELTSKQAEAVAAVARDFGYGIIDVTTRSNFQVQGLDISDVPAALERLAQSGLTTKQTGHDNIRNVAGHPFSGLDPEELIDTRDLCRQITELIVDNRELSDLPRKFNISLCGRPAAAVHYWTQDMSYIAHQTADGRTLFQVLVGGRQGQDPQIAQPLPLLTAPEQVVKVTEGLLQLFREQGSREKRDRSRFWYLVEQLGVEAVAEHLRRVLPFDLPPLESPPLPRPDHEDFVGWFRQKQPGRWTLGVALAVGRLTWKQLDGLATVARRWGDETLRTTYLQSLLIPNLPTEAKVLPHVARLGLSPEADPVSRNMVACTGKQFCNIAVTETKGTALRLIEQLRSRGVVLHGIRIHMSGCPSACAQHHTADIGLKGVRVRRRDGTREGFDCYLGGGAGGPAELGRPYKSGVDHDQLPQLIEEVVHEYYQHGQPGETFSQFWRARLNGAAPKVGDKDYRPPIWLCEKCHYQYHGEDPPVFCPKCSALRREFARLEDEGSDPALGPASRGNPTCQVVNTAAQPASLDGFLVAAPESAVPQQHGLRVEVAGREMAIFRVEGRILAIDNECPHAGGPLSEGEVRDGVVTCPWHGWRFDVCRGCSLEPQGHDVTVYETRVENDQIRVRLPCTAGPTAHHPS